MAHHLPVLKELPTQLCSMKGMYMFYLQNHLKYDGPKLQLDDMLSHICFPWVIFLQIFMFFHNKFN